MCVCVLKVCVPFSLAKHGVVGSWLRMLRTRPGIPRTEKSPKTGHADDWVYGDWVYHKVLKSGSSKRGRCRQGRSEIPHFSSRLQSFALVLGGKTKKNEKNRKIPPTPSTPTPLGTSQLRGGHRGSDFLLHPVL